MTEERIEKERARVKQYGLTLEAYEQMYKIQNGQCSICSQPKKILSVDHDHSTGRVRGLLCKSCNHGLGFFYDNIALLMKAKLYLEKEAPHASTRY